MNLDEKKALFNYDDFKHKISIEEPSPPLFVNIYFQLMESLSESNFELDIDLVGEINIDEVKLKLGDELFQKLLTYKTDFVKKIRRKINIYSFIESILFYEKTINIDKLIIVYRYEITWLFFGFLKRIEIYSAFEAFRLPTKYSHWFTDLKYNLDIFYKNNIEAIQFNGLLFFDQNLFFEKTSIERVNIARNIKVTKEHRKHNFLGEIYYEYNYDESCMKEYYPKKLRNLSLQQYTKNSKPVYKNTNMIKELHNELLRSKYIDSTNHKFSRLFQNKKATINWIGKKYELIFFVNDLNHHLKISNDSNIYIWMCENFTLNNKKIEYSYEFGNIYKKHLRRPCKKYNAIKYKCEKLRDLIWNYKLTKDPNQKIK